MVLLYILLGLVLLIALLLIAPVMIFASLDQNGLKVDARYLFFKFKILPDDKPDSGGKLQATVAKLLSALDSDVRKAKKDKSGRKTGKKKGQPSAWKLLKKDHGFFGAIATLFRMVGAEVYLVVYVIRRISIDKLRARISLCGEDAAQAAVRSGQWCAWCYPIVSLVSCAVRRLKSDIVISPDFLSDEDRFDIQLRARFALGSAVMGVIKTIIRLVRSEVADRIDEANDGLDIPPVRTGNNTNKK